MHARQSQMDMHANAHRGAARRLRGLRHGHRAATRLVPDRCGRCSMHNCKLLVHMLLGALPLYGGAAQCSPPLQARRWAGDAVWPLPIYWGAVQCSPPLQTGSWAGAAAQAHPLSRG